MSNDRVDGSHAANWPFSEDLGTEAFSPFLETETTSQSPEDAGALPSSEPSGAGPALLGTSADTITAAAQGDSKKRAVAAAKASLLAEARRAAQQKELPEDESAEYLTEIGESLVKAAKSREFDFKDQMNLASALLNSPEVRGLKRPRAVLITAMKVVASDKSLSETSKAALGEAILSSHLALHASPKEYAFLINYWYCRDLLRRPVPSDPRLEAKATVACADALVAHGAVQTFPTRAALHNAIGRTLGLQPEHLPRTEADREAAKQHTWELFAGEELTQIRRIADILEAGGSRHGVSFLPVVFQAASMQSPPQTLYLFVVNQGGVATVVDSHGRVSVGGPGPTTGYAIAELLQHLGAGYSRFPWNGRVTVQSDGIVNTVTLPNAP